MISLCLVNDCSWQKNFLHSCFPYFPAIVMSHYKLKAREVAQCLVSGTSDLTPDVLRQLLVFAPDDREVTTATWNRLPFGHLPEPSITVFPK